MELTTIPAIAFAVVLSAWTVSVSAAEPSAPADGWLGIGKDLAERETLTNHGFGLGETLESRGIAVALSLTQAYQINLRGGTATHRHAGRYAGSYDLELEVDTEKLIGLPGGSMYVLAEGSWSDGLDDSSIGSLYGVHDDAGGDRSVDVTELWYQQRLLDGRLRVRVGKIDLTGGFECRGCAVAFDGSAFANDETAQFLNGALVNNPSIPFPDNGLGAVVYLEPADGFYVSAGAADAQADARETGFRTAFHREDHFLAIFETGLAASLPSARGPMPGAYRAGFWYDPQPKERFDGGRAKRDDVGLYLSFDQVLLKENADEEDTQGFGAFLRYGYAHAEAHEIRCFWGAGGQYQGLLPGRDDDVVAVGLASGCLSPDAGFGRTHESVMEVYYAAQVTPWLAVSPSFQYVWNPGGADGVGDACILGVRVQLLF